MLLTEFLSKSRIVPELKVTSKAGAIAELARLLFEQQKAKTVGPVLDEIMAREAMESTGIGRGIAVPHARVSEFGDLVCSVGRVKDGLEFKAVDREPVYLIFLICYPPTHQTTYLNFIATLAKLFQDDEPLRLLLEATTAAEIFTTLRDVSKALREPEKRFPKKGVHPGALLDAETPGAVVLLARLELCTEMLESANSGRAEIKQRIENISALLDPKLLAHYYRLKKKYQHAVVAVELGICQGCLMQLPSQLAQSMLRDRSRVECCSHCHRFVYLI